MWVAYPAREILVSISPVRVISVLPASVQFNEIENYSLLKERYNGAIYEHLMPPLIPHRL
jgi:hypothetical protein